ncbi:tachykinin-like peptides receptor 99D [Sitodiplosis mosellana]|uniref:tachykinin-like peptides receptor 99D n=1 Tax=Sitodiplosis mosellana TaxID=263140 RepID=UPI002443FBAA|nr:tachykinin-like peptides receptor 99D [Sitodiplosis mosellana]XP_055323158.1 tachykinin-like peptides receptor 99D [Sitodiplosis mosellana]
MDANTTSGFGNIVQNSSRVLNMSEIDLDNDILYEVPIGIIVLLSIFYGSISIIAVIGNSLVIWIVATTRPMQTVTNLFIANLALADVVIGMFVIPFQFQAALLQRWNLPEFMCAFCPFVQTVSVNVSVFTLTAIAVDRHRAIINPLRARPPRYISKIIIAFIWVISLAFSIPMAIALRVVKENSYQVLPDKTIEKIEYPFCNTGNMDAEKFQQYRYYLVFVQYFIPFGVISFVYIQMAIRLWGSKTPGNAQDTRDITLMRNKKRVIKMLIIVVLLFGICWFPLQLYNILHVTWDGVNEYKYINIVWFCSDWLAMSNSCYNPFIYGIYNEKFKREFRRRFPLFRFTFEHTDVSEKNVSMYTRASSIRSNYTTTSTKTKFMIPQRIVGGNDSLQHYNALHIADPPVVKNNNVMNGNHNWTVKSSWQSAFNQSPVVANGTVVEWQDKKCVCFSKIYCKGTDHPGCTATTTTTTKTTAIPLTSAQNNKNALLEPLTNNVKTGSIYSHDTAKNCCCCCQGRKTICKDNNIFDSELCCMPKTAAEWEQVNLCKAECSANNKHFKCDERDEDIDDNDGDDTDFRNEIIRINNIYNNCNANANTNANDNANTNAEAVPGENFHLHGFNNSCISLSKYKNDINL